ncbi:MAG TPA: HTH domain-containing protein [Bacteroidia bacterium]|jgi:DNA-binding IclR family transcriptional regulator
MKFNEYQEKLERLRMLVESGNTGSPKELAKTLSVSERTARRLVDQLKLHHAIIFCRKSNSYILKD